MKVAGGNIPTVAGRNPWPPAFSDSQDNWQAKQAEHGAFFPLPDLLHLRASLQAKSHRDVCNSRAWL